MNVALDLIMPHLSRWRTFSLIVDAFEPMHTFLSRMQGSTPNLLELSLYNNSSAASFDPSELFHPVHLRTAIKLPPDVAPKLEVFCVWAVHILWSHFPFSNLTNLELAYHAPDVQPTFAEFDDMLRASPNLQSLTLIDSGPAASSRYGFENTSILLPSLTELTFGCFYDLQYTIHLLQFLRIPNLRKLTLQELCDADFGPFIKAIGGPPGLFPRVETLVLSSIEANDASAFSHLFSSFSDLKRLEVDCNDLEPVLLYPLIGSPGRPDLPRNVLCPKLSAIKVAGLSNYVRAFVERRLAGDTSPIKEVYINSKDEVTPEDYMWLEKHVETVATYYDSDNETEDENIDEDEDDGEDDG